MSRSRIAVLVASLAVLLAPSPSRALFHLAHISEVMSGANGNPSIQFVEIRMASGLQNATTNSRLTAFNCDGTTASVLMVVPGSVPNEGTNVRWIMASPSGAAFLAASGINADFTWDNGVTGNIETTCGMVCWGAPGLVPPAPGSWSASDPNQYVDCVAYGPYTGPTKTSTHDTTPPSGTPTTLTPGDGTFSLTRVAFGGNNATDFALDCPSPTNNAGNAGNFGACSPPTTTTSAPSTTTTSTTLPENKCAGAKLKAAAKKASCLLGLSAKAAKSGDPADPVKVQGCKDKFSGAFAKAESKQPPPCLTTGDTAGVEGRIDTFAGDVTTALDVAPDPSKCQSKKLKAAGKKAKCLLQIESKEAAKGELQDAAKVTQCKDKFSSAFAKAETETDCGAATGDTDAIETMVDDMVDDVDGALVP